MAYFSGGTDGEALFKLCAECPVGQGQRVSCPVLCVQKTYNYRQHNDNEISLSRCLDMLISRNESGAVKCSMRDAMQQAKEATP